MNFHRESMNSLRKPIISEGYRCANQQVNTQQIIRDNNNPQIQSSKHPSIHSSKKPKIPIRRINKSISQQTSHWGMYL